MTAAAVEEAVNNVYGSSQQADLVQVISAFEVPKTLYDPIRKSFYQRSAPSSVLADAKVRVLAV